VLCLGALAYACAGKVIKTRQTIENICTGHLLSQRHTIPRIRPAKHKHKHLWKVGVRRGQEEQHKSDRQQWATGSGGRLPQPVGHQPHPLMDATRRWPEPGEIIMQNERRWGGAIKQSKRTCKRKQLCTAWEQRVEWRRGSREAWMIWPSGFSCLSWLARFPDKKVPKTGICVGICQSSWILGLGLPKLGFLFCFTLQSIHIMVFTLSLANHQSEDGD